MEDYKKKYEEALGRARTFSQRWQGIEATDSELALQELKEIFPELKVSDDESMKKMLINIVNITPATVAANNRKELIAWIEKQGEQGKEIKYIYPKFRVGDVIEPAKPNGYSAPVRVKYIGNGSYSCESDDCKSFLSFPIRNENEYVLTGQKPAWSEEDEEIKNIIESCIDRVYDKDACFDNKPKSTCINWFINLNPHPKIKWSEEDERMIHFMIEYLERLNRPTGNSCIKWLISLKERIKGE